MNTQNPKSSESLLHKTRPLQIAVLVIAVVLGSIMLFNKGNGNAENTYAAVAEEDSKVLILTDAAFEQTIAEGVTLVDFWAVWCPPCRIQNPIIEEVAVAIDDMAKIAKLDVDHNPRSASLHRVQNIPTLIIFKDGEPVQRFVGVQQKETLMAAIKSHI